MSIWISSLLAVHPPLCMRGGGRRHGGNHGKDRVHLDQSRQRPMQTAGPASRPEGRRHDDQMVHSRLGTISRALAGGGRGGGRCSHVSRYELLYGKHAGRRAHAGLYSYMGGGAGQPKG